MRLFWPKIQVLCTFKIGPLAFAAILGSNIDNNYIIIESYFLNILFVLRGPQTQNGYFRWKLNTDLFKITNISLLIL